MRAAIVRQHASLPSRELVRQYLYGNFAIATSLEVDGSPALLIAGEDQGGFTLDAVIDRLASGLISAYEVDPETGARL